jgi:glycosyltransferase involved in cell wall biosynthesis
MKSQLTVLIPCKNERRNIRPCIDSVRTVADEILIADSGSEDGTLDIVRDMGGCRIIEREYVHSANFKNWAIPQARHPWVLIVDADERVTPKLASEIQHVLDQPEAEIDGYWIGRKNHFLGYHIAHCGWNSDDVLRLFRRDVGRYRERWVHAEIELPKDRVRRLKQPFDHYTTWNSDEFWRKQNRYATWGALNMRDEGRKPSVASMVFRGPMRFLQLYFLRLGFLDGVPGLHVCAYTAFYTFMKQARLWELHHAKAQPDPEAEIAGQSIKLFPATPQTAEGEARMRRAA